MEKTAWKITAIIFIIISLMETMYIVYAIYLYNQELENTNICYYDICEDYVDATYEKKLCTCWGYDVLGEYIIEEQEYMR